MRFTFDHDLHIHSNISLCSKDPEQTNERILQYAIDNNLNTICLANHYWDENVEGATNWYERQNYEHIAAANPLPNTEDVRFLFGCETEFDRDMTLAISPQKFDDFRFIVIPTTHFHMSIGLYDEQRESAETIAAAWIKKLDALFNMQLPFHKIGIAHLVCRLIAPDWQLYLDTLNAIPQEEMQRVFSKAAKLGVGIELNSGDFRFKDEDADTILRIFRTAKDCGCKFYIGSDAHSVDELKAAPEFINRSIDLLDLKENDKFDFSNL